MNMIKKYKCIRSCFHRKLYEKGQTIETDQDLPMAHFICLTPDPEVIPEATPEAIFVVIPGISTIPTEPKKIYNFQKKKAVANVE